MTMNIFPSPGSDEKIANTLKLIGQPLRIQMLVLLSQGEACVCHMEAYLGIRQAVISQNLMALREAGLVFPRRVGRNIYYQLADEKMVDLIQQTAVLCGLQWDDLLRMVSQPKAICLCPHCNPDKPDCSISLGNHQD